ncbi:primosomal protein N' [Capnocytophaga genosp. AHN8471]|uniref:Replication restart protein PriA n=1 Tax=Capnocytophaga genosp. AHN8471 TaxID=327574 RepID=A0ABS1YWA0_9FLAO|nr:primosomal protein N' [Capnocytophaga genosp. AHN8471]MBM0650699.1 primosomal protein N' [Capnocytophaga genosp. AHN8471]MBM0661887.1 primosomal protein N' [Capnocytophaga genosp. AHN8471]
MYFVEVILPLPIPKLYTYRINEDEAHFLQTGMRVAVSFGKSKVYTALVHKVHTNEPTYETKDIEYILDETPIVTPNQITHWQWIADYYMCTLGEVIKSALPSAFLLESETIIEIAEKDLNPYLFSDDEFQVYEALHYKTALKGSEVSKIIPKKKTLKVIKSLVEKGAARISERIFEKYVPKLVKYIRLAEAYQSQEGLQEALELLKGEKQKKLIMAYFNHINREVLPLKVENLLEEAKVSNAVLKSVVEKGILEIYYLQKDRVSFADSEVLAKKTLNNIQNEALYQVQQQFQTKNTVLLQGVTASGKTEIYIELIDQYLKKGKQVLYLLPEIALTIHLINRLKKHFGKNLSVYHSKYNTNERVEVWNNVLNNCSKAQLVVGVRSSVYLPFKDLGLVVIDEEHDSSYRQFDPAPRLQARDSAIMLANIFKAKTLLGTATPSIESMHNVKVGKYGFVYLSKRYTNFLPPIIELIDIKDKQHRKRMNGHFSDILIEEMTNTLSQGKQVLLFQNRRGYAPIVQCMHCGTVPQCPHCDVSLTFHHSSNQLRCHYCGYAIPMPKTCIACGSVDLKTKGFGTEQISKELEVLFPQVAIDRMDQDTTNGKYGYEKILAKFEQQETQILVGTQMISKGLDFENIGLVGVMNADALIHSPDYRAYERSFQLLLQVSGRAGRSAQRGKVLIQTYNPQHPVIQQVLQNDFKGMYQNQIEERQSFSYPPFVQMIKITLKHTNFNRTNEGAEWFANALKEAFASKKGIEILGPEFPLISRIRNEYLKDVLVKVKPSELSIHHTKEQIKRIETSFQSISNFRTIRVSYLID